MDSFPGNSCFWGNEFLKIAPGRLVCDLISVSVFFWNRENFGKKHSQNHSPITSLVCVAICVISMCCSLCHYQKRIRTQIVETLVLYAKHILFKSRRVKRQQNQSDVPK